MAILLPLQGRNGRTSLVMASKWRFLMISYDFFKLLRLRRFLELLQHEKRSLNAAARACEVLELLCRGQEELVSLLNRHHILPALASCLLAAAKKSPPSAWLPFATFLAGLK